MNFGKVISNHPSLVISILIKADIELSVYVLIEVALASSFVFLSNVPDAGLMESTLMTELPLLPVTLKQRKHKIEFRNKKS